MRLRTIFEQCYPMSFTKRRPTLHRAHLPVQVNQQDRPRFRTDASLHADRVKQCRAGIDIRKHRCSAGMDNGVHASAKCQRRGYYLISDLQAVNYDTLSSATVLQAVYVLVRKDCRKKEILKLAKEDVIAIWPKAVEAIRASIDYFRNYYRIPVSRLLPYPVTSQKVVGRAGALASV